MSQPDASLPRTLIEEQVSRTRAGELEGLSPLAPEPVSRVTVPGYEILEELGRGGMGVVYKAKQVRANRLVALKMILTGSHAGTAELRRFRTEVEAIASLRHSAIIPVYEVGEHEGRPFFSLELCSGGTLHRKLNGTPLPPTEAARLIETLAHAMQVAHEHHIIHRDLKPENVLFADDGSPRITDFGLAKKLDADEGTTRTGAIMGTPSYMAPEQTRGASHEVTPAVDVYALGAILYECLTGRPPFKAATTMETIMQVATHDPVAPRDLQPGVPRDLETICLKCLAKEPHRRYSSAQALAEDLRCFQAGEPIDARPIGWLERAGKWVRRRPTSAALLGVLVAGALVALAVGVWFTRTLQFERDEATRAHLDAEQRAQSEAEALQISQNERRDADLARLKTETTLIDMATAFGLNAGEQGRPAQAALWFASAARQAHRDPQREGANRTRFALWDRQLVAPLRAFDHGGEGVLKLFLHPEGTHLITQTEKGRFTLWDVEREAQADFPVPALDVRSAAWSPDGKMLALGLAQGEVGLWRWPLAQKLHTLEHPGAVVALRFSDDGRYLALGSFQVRVWDLRAKRFVTPLLSHPAPVASLVFNGRATTLVSAGTENRAQVFTVPSETALPLFKPSLHHYQGYQSLRQARVDPVFVNQDRALVFASLPTQLSCLDATTGQPIWQNTTGMLNSLAVSPDQRTLAVGLFDGIQFLDASNGKRVGSVIPQRHFAPALSFSPDGRMLLSVSFDRTARFWTVPAGQPASPEIAHQDGIMSLATAPARDLFATGQFDGLVRLWRWQTGEALPRVPFRWETGNMELAALSTDERLLLPCGSATRTQVHTLATGEPQGKLLSAAGVLRATLFSPDGAKAATLSTVSPQQNDVMRARQFPGWVEVWDWKEGKRCFDAVKTRTESMGGAFSPDGKLLVVACAGGQVLLLDAETGEEKHALQVPDSHYWYLLGVTVTFRSDGSAFLVGGLGKNVVEIEPATGEVRRTFALPELSTSVAYSPDGRWILTANINKQVRFWDAATGEPAFALLEHPDWVFRARFSRDGRHVVTACRDGMARLWDWQTRQLVCPALEHKDEVYDVALSPDGRWIFTVCRDRTGRFWDALTGKPMSPALSIPSYDVPTAQARFTPDGKHLIVGSLRVYDVRDFLTPDPHRIQRDDLFRLGEIVSGQTLRENNTLVNLTSQEWLASWQAFRKAHPNYHTLPEVRVLPRPVPPVPPSPVIVLPPRKKPRTATAEQIREWIDQLGGAEAAVARTALREVGTAALPALQQAVAQTADREQKQALEEVLDEIALSVALEEPRVRLRFDGTPATDAAEALGRAAGVCLAVPANLQTVSLELDDVPFWEALDRFGEKTELRPDWGSFYSQTELRLIAGKKKATLARTAGPFLISPLVGMRQRSYETSGQESVSLSLRIAGVPGDAVQRVEKVWVHKAENQAGKSLELGPGATAGPLGTREPSGFLVGIATVPLRSLSPGGTIRKLEGRLAVDVVLNREVLGTVPDLGKAQGRWFTLAPGVRCRVQNVRQNAGAALVQLQISSSTPLPVALLRERLSLFDEQGRPYRLTAANPSLVPPVPTPALEELAWLAGGLQAPWPALALRSEYREAAHTLLVELVGNNPERTSKPAELRYSNVQKRRVEIPFTLENIPLP
jgi:WD40 repeat protein